MVVGDQLATDGVLAWRLGFAFAYVRHPETRHPWGPAVLRQLSRPLRRLLFRLRQPDRGVVPDGLPIVSGVEVRGRISVKEESDG